MCVLYVSYGSKVRPRTFMCVAIVSAVYDCMHFLAAFVLVFVYMMVMASA